MGFFAFKLWLFQCSHFHSFFLVLTYVSNFICFLSLILLCLSPCQVYPCVCIFLFIVSHFVFFFLLSQVLLFSSCLVVLIFNICVIILLFPRLISCVINILIKLVCINSPVLPLSLCLGVCFLCILFLQFLPLPVCNTRTHSYLPSFRSTFNISIELKHLTKVTKEGY